MKCVYNFCPNKNEEIKVIPGYGGLQMHTECRRKYRQKIEDKKPLFTTKHYKAIAELLKSLDRENLEFWTLAGAFREMFEKDNSRFNEPKFRKAIGLVLIKGNLN